MRIATYAAPAAASTSARPSGRVAAAHAHAMPATTQRRRTSAQHVATANTTKTASVYAIESTKLPGPNANSAVARSADSASESSRVKNHRPHVPSRPNTNTTIPLAV